MLYLGFKLMLRPIFLFNMFTKEDKKGDFNAEKCHFLILENTTIKVDVENHSPDRKLNPRNQRAVG